MSVSCNTLKGEVKTLLEVDKIPDEQVGVVRSAANTALRNSEFRIHPPLPPFERRENQKYEWSGFQPKYPAHIFSKLVYCYYPSSWRRTNGTSVSYPAN